MIYPQRPALWRTLESRSKAVCLTGKEGKAVKIRPGRQKDSGAPTPAGVCLDDLIQKFADDQHGEGLIYTSWHSNLAGQSVQYGAIDASETFARFAPNGIRLYSFLALSFHPLKQENKRTCS
jgi:hypothetical protein